MDINLFKKKPESDELEAENKELKEKLSHLQKAHDDLKIELDDLKARASVSDADIPEDIRKELAQNKREAENQAYRQRYFQSRSTLVKEQPPAEKPKEDEDEKRKIKIED